MLNRLSINSEGERTTEINFCRGRNSNSQPLDPQASVLPLDHITAPDIITVTLTFMRSHPPMTSVGQVGGRRDWRDAQSCSITALRPTQPAAASNSPAGSHSSVSLLSGPPRVRRVRPCTRKASQHRTARYRPIRRSRLQTARSTATRDAPLPPLCRSKSRCAAVMDYSALFLYPLSVDEVVVD